VVVVVGATVVVVVVGATVVVVVGEGIVTVTAAGEPEAMLSWEAVVVVKDTENGSASANELVPDAPTATVDVAVIAHSVDDAWETVIADIPVNVKSTPLVVEMVAQSIRPPAAVREKEIDAVDDVAAAAESVTAGAEAPSNARRNGYPSLIAGFMSQMSVKSQLAAV
jgi:acetylornithine deacetylase/succinyl-diaminopimelate desuccinylase-like protein